MPLDIAAGAKPAASFPVQFVNIEVTPLIDGEFGVVMQATLLDEEQLEFIGEDLANVHVETLEQAVAVIRQNIAVIAQGAGPGERP